MFSREKLEHIVEAIPDGIVVIDRYGHIVFINTTAEEILDIKRNDVIGQAYEVTSRKTTTVGMNPAQREEHLVPRGIDISGIGVQAHGIEHTYEHTDGARVIASVNAAPLSDAVGTVEGTVLSLRDVTELKKTEGELRFKSFLLDSAMDSIIAHDPQGKIIYVNETAHKTRGYMREELMAIPLQKLEVPEHAKLIKPRMGILMKIGSAVFESAHMKRDGTVMPVEVNARVIEFEGKDIIVNVIRDITERKRAEEALKAGEKKLRDITSALGEGIIELDVNGRVTFMNPEAEHLLGWNEAELLGKNLHRIIHYQRANRTPIPAEECHVLEIITEGRIYRTEDDVFTRKDGRIVPVAYIATPIVEDRKVVGSVTAFQDITEHKRVAEELKRSEASLAEAQHIAHMGSWDWDIRTNELFWSNEIYRVFGLDPQQFGATYEAFLSSVHPDDREFVKKSVDIALYEHKPYCIDHRIVLPDGTERIVHEQAEVILDEAGRAIRMVGTIQDITERKLAEEILEKKRQLEKQVYADAMAAVTGGQFMLCTYEDIEQQRRGLPVLSQFVTKPEEIHPFRTLLDTFLKSRGLEPSRRYDVQFATVEALTNSVKYAGGGRLQIRADEVLQIEVADSGPGINFSMLPRSVLMLGFSTKGTLGFGFTIMLEFSDRLYLATGPTGTSLILEFHWS